MAHSKGKSIGPALRCNCRGGDPRRGGAMQIRPVLERIDLTPERPIRVCVEETWGGGKPQAHMHLALEIGILLSGRVRQDNGHGWFSLRPGQVWACGAFEVHRWHGLCRARELRFDFLPSLFAEIPSLAGLDPGVVFRSPLRRGAIGARPRFLRRMIAFGRGLARKYRCGALPGQAYVDLLRLLEQVRDEARRGAWWPEQPWSDLGGAVRIQPAFAFIEKSPAARMRVADAARACGMSERNFARSFKLTTGMGFAEFALRSRLASAAHLLRSSDASLKAIARRFGFVDASHFHHAFLSHYGVTPGRYRVQRGA